MDQLLVVRQQNDTRGTTVESPKENRETERFANEELLETQEWEERGRDRERDRQAAAQVFLFSLLNTKHLKTTRRTGSGPELNLD